MSTTADAELTAGIRAMASLQGIELRATQLDYISASIKRLHEVTTPTSLALNIDDVNAFLKALEQWAG
jgi:hypothetical protein